MTPLDVFGLQADQSGCGTLRIALPLQALRNRGYNTLYGERVHKDIAVRSLIGQRVCVPGASAQWQEMAARKRRPRMLLELDDDLWSVDATSQTAFNFFSAPGVQRRLEENLRAADAVTVTMEPLAEQVRRFNPNVHVVPNYLPAWLLGWERLRSDEGTVTVGWGGSPSHAMDVVELGGQLRQVMRRNPHVEFHLIGTDYSKEFGAGKRTRVTTWARTPADYWRTIDFDVMLAPLRPHVFNASKSALRCLEAAMLGIPVIASDYGPYSSFVQHGVTGYLVKRDHEWGRYLTALVNDPAMRAEMGANARAQASAWTIEGNVESWEKVLLP